MDNTCHYRLSIDNIVKSYFAYSIIGVIRLTLVLCIMEHKLAHY